MKRSVALFAMIVALLATTGCGTVDKSVLEIAEYGCKHYNGVDEVRRNFFLGDSVVCLTGKKFFVANMIDEYSKHVQSQSKIIRD